MQNMDYIQEIINLCCDYTIGGKTINEESYNEFARIMDNHFYRFEKDCSNLVVTNPYIISKLKGVLEFTCLCFEEADKQDKTPIDTVVSFCTYYLFMKQKCKRLLAVINCFPSVHTMHPIDLQGIILSWKDPQEPDTTLEPQQSTETVQESEIVLPPELSTDEALMYWEKAKEKGFVDANYQFLGTRYQATHFAEIMAEKLKIKHKWKPFKKLWHYDKFAQTKYEKINRFWNVPKQDEIDSIFD